MANKEGFVPPKNTSDLVAHLNKTIKNKKVSIYIDSANLYFASNVAKLKIDFIQFAKWFKKNCKLTGLNFYTAFNPDDPKQLTFLKELEDEGYRIVKKPIKVFETSKKGNMDIELAVDALLQKDMYETLILLSGDGDFSYLVQALAALGRETIIIGIGGFTSYELHQEASDYFFLNRITSVWQKPRSRKKTTKKQPQMTNKKNTKNNTKPTNNPSQDLKIFF
ncbi:NYN domain-containing protein [Candidatus Gracilibacteria bacterium]|nr:NYN domain-containing protein [Candidatus Gracilibacteria bacterium]NJS41510.1 NYN domain-containing protein [Candidatus Gracilibacteria bacterium]